MESWAPSSRRSAPACCGSFASPLVRRLLPVRAVLLLELWTWLSCAVFLVWPNVYVLTASILPTAIAFPSTDSVVHGYGIAMTPDRLLAPSLDELAELPGRLFDRGGIPAPARHGRARPRRRRCAARRDPSPQPRWRCTRAARWVQLGVEELAVP